MHGSSHQTERRSNRLQQVPENRRLSHMIASSIPTPRKRPLTWKQEEAQYKRSSMALMELSSPMDRVDQARLSQCLALTQSSKQSQMVVMEYLTKFRSCMALFRELSATSSKQLIVSLMQKVPK